MNGIELLHELAQLRIPDSDSLSLIFIVATQLYASVFVGNPLKHFQKSRKEFLDPYPDLDYPQNVLDDMHVQPRFAREYQVLLG